MINPLLTESTYLPSPKGTSNASDESGRVDSYLPICGLRIRYVVVGSGADVLVLHGWGASLEQLEPLIADLARNFRVTAFDFPGHGRSSFPREAWGVDEFVRLTLDLSNAVGLINPSIIAHSFGARVAIRLASRASMRIHRLILTGAAGIPSRPTLRKTLSRRTVRTLRPFARFLGPWRDAVSAAFARILTSKDWQQAGALRPTFRRIVTEDLTQDLPLITAKTLLIWGKADSETPLESGRKMYQLIPGAQLIVFDGVGHFPFLERATRFAVEAKRFLRD